MKVSDYVQLDAIGLAELIAQGHVSADQVQAAAQQAIARVEPQVNALAEHWHDEPLPSPAGGPLYGVPFLIKDLAISMQGRAHEFGSRLAQGTGSTTDSFLMQRFRRAGLLTLGRTTIPELAISTTTESHLCGPTRNPWDRNRSAGGSSGGSAAAVASGMVPVAHATDGGGSIRVPAAACGLFGLKPGRGLISMGPFMDEAWNGLAVQGVLSRSVRDSALLLDCMAGAHAGDPFPSAPAQGGYLSALAQAPGALKIAVQRHPLNGQRSDPLMVEALEKLLRTLESLGHRCEQVNLDIGLSWEAFVEMNARFWASNTAAWLDGLSTETGRPLNGDWLEPATLALHRYGKVLSATDLLAAMDQRNLVSRRLGGFFQRFDLLLSPTLSTLPPVIGAYNAGQEQLDGLGWMHRVFDHSPFTALANICGTPSMSVPLYQDAASGLPIGMQFTAGAAGERLLLSLAGQLEQALPWRGRTPPVWAARS
ncbi:amidase [Pseudomonas rubra]|uniref:Amidase family protein n=1 Tax=Pseudomonas rubra TaxID=2942627 RepID=A0ABT5PGA5_9PSED|nr:amidase family protein [Pseudomonas rubra]MDD1017226.1 amidase family protein [Pseudomonas rubra]MDD1041157.1 amidase family protein [Pseudomonas rubra]MDD1157757.1 amidase family protein [Pseudomonas rubra]